MHLLSSYTSRCVKEFILDPGYLSIWPCSTGLNKEFCLLKGKEFLPSAKTQTFSNSLCKLHNLLVDLCYCISLFFLSDTLTSWYFSPLCIKTTEAFGFIICAYCSSKHVVVLVLCFFLTSYTLEKIVIVDLKNEDCYCLTIKCLFCCKWHIFRQWPLSPSLQSQVFQASLMQEASWVLRETVEVSSGPLRIYRKKLQVYWSLCPSCSSSYCLYYNRCFIIIVCVCLVVVVVCLCLGCFSE